MSTAPPTRIAVPLGDFDELLWADPVADDRYRVRQIVSLATGLAPDDLVRCLPGREGQLEVVEVVERGGFCSIGLLFAERALDHDCVGVLFRLGELGCTTEQVARHAWGVAVPRGAWSEVQAFLDGCPTELAYAVLCPPDAPTPFPGPFAPPDETAPPSGAEPPAAM